jgi:hypothetical protein
MKKILLLIWVVFLFSCEKESLHCYKCETIANNEVVSIVTTCGMTESDIMDFQAGLETQSSALLKCETKTECLIKN